MTYYNMRKILFTCLLISISASLIFYVGLFQNDKSLVDNVNGINESIEITPTSQRVLLHSDEFLEKIEQEKDTAELALKRYKTAVTQRRSAELVFSDIELRVAELEEYVDELEYEGLALEDIQNKTLAKFQKVFAAYQDAELSLEDARVEEESSLEFLEQQKTQMQD